MERSFYMERLPYIDEHAISIGAPREQVWSALVGVVRASFGGAARMAHALGCDPAEGSGRFEGETGQTLPGFRVAEAEPGRRLALRGQHRFSRYALTFVLDDDGRLRAQTHAAFPGLGGRLYRLAVIGSGGHRILVRRMLRRVAARA